MLVCIKGSIAVAADLFGRWTVKVMSGAKIRRVIHLVADEVVDIRLPGFGGVL